MVGGIGALKGHAAPLQGPLKGTPLQSPLNWANYKEILENPRLNFNLLVLETFHSYRPLP